MIEKTTEYEMFIFREDNRAKIDQSHVARLIESMRCKNMMDICPIKVNGAMEIIDGQHRMLAAKSLGVPVYYEKIEELQPEDMIRMNISKSWGVSDYLNYYCHHQYDHYIRLKQFMQRNSLQLKVALNIAIGESKLSFVKFRQGEFEYREEDWGDSLDICWDTVRYIKKMNGYSAYTESSRFWKSLLKLVRHPGFDLDRWNNNMQKQVDHFGPRARTEDYLRMMQKIYNFKNTNKIVITDEE